MQRAIDAFLMVLAPALAICLALLGLETTPHNMFGWLLFGLGAAYPGAILIHNHARREVSRRTPRQGSTHEEERGGVSFWVLLPGFLIAFFGPPLEWTYLAPILPRAVACQIAGGVLFLGALALVIWARVSLRATYSAALRVSVGNRLVQNGPYRIIRHPAYSGLLFMALGVAIGYSSALGLASIAALLVPALVYRIAAEERLLRRHFEGEYAAYAARAG
jgi:protein-S-isoprenylcysteine O-methyltransferase Ste14